MAKDLTIFDFCKPGFKPSRTVDVTEGGLEGEELLAHASMGCQPVISHFVTEDGTILSRYDQRNGKRSGALLTLPASGFGFINPVYPQPSDFLATVKTAPSFPIGTIPTFPAVPPKHLIQFVKDGIVYTYVASDDMEPTLPVQIGSDFKFAPTAGIQLVADDKRLSPFSGQPLRAYWPHHLTVSYAIISDQIEPTQAYKADTGGYAFFTLNATFVSDLAGFYIWVVPPVMTEASAILLGGTITNMPLPNVTPHDPLTYGLLAGGRRRALFQSEDVVAAAFAGTLEQNIAVLGEFSAVLRAYTDSSTTTSIEVNGATGNVAMISPAPEIGSGPAVLYDCVHEFAISPFVASIHVDVNGLSAGTLSGLTGPAWYEIFVP